MRQVGGRGNMQRGWRGFLLLLGQTGACVQAQILVGAHCAFHFNQN